MSDLKPDKPRDSSKQASCLHDDAVYESEQKSVLTILDGLRSRQVRPGSLSTNEKRACVAYLTDEGYSAAEIAKLLGRCERTICRWRKLIREKRRHTYSQDFVAVSIGELLHQCALAIQRSRRAARGPNVSVRDKLTCEVNAMQILLATSQRLQSMGVLPLARETHDAAHEVAYEQAKQRHISHVGVSLGEAERRGVHDWATQRAKEINRRLREGTDSDDDRSMGEEAGSTSDCGESPELGPGGSEQPT